MGGKQLRLNKNTSATKIPVLNGDYVDYILKTEVTSSMPTIGAAVLYGTDVLVTTGSGSLKSNYTAVQRDAYGRAIKVGYWQKKYNCNCNCNCNCCNCGDDSGCFIKAELMTTSGPKPVETIVPGDMLIGIDGIHKVVAVAINILGHRKAVTVAGHSDTWLTQEHIILHKGMPTVRSETDYLRSRDLLNAPNGAIGSYANPALDKLIRVDEKAFIPVSNLSSDTRTYSPIVESGCWAMTKDGLNVLLCRQL